VLRVRPGPGRLPARPGGPASAFGQVIWGCPASHAGQGRTVPAQSGGTAGLPAGSQVKTWQNPQLGWGP